MSRLFFALFFFAACFVRRGLTPGWFGVTLSAYDLHSSQTYYQKLLERRRQILSLDCNTRGKMQHEWISLIVEVQHTAVQ